ARSRFSRPVPPLAQPPRRPAGGAARFSGELTHAAAVDLVDTVDLLVRVYYYPLVELQISSNGGASTALEHYLDAQRRWREAGVRVRTRVVERAASAAAFMLSLGDERIAEPGASLVYHLFRIPPDAPVTASRAAVMFRDLTALDDRSIARLVDRVLADDPQEVSADVEPSDFRILDWLTAELPHGARRRPRRARGLARVLERAVRRALRNNDRPTLTQIYRELCRSELTISPAVARIVRLIDHVGTPPARVARAAGTAGLAIPQWAALYPPTGEVPREILTRHTLALGDTGSGKTFSAVFPILRALLAAPPGRVGGVLVIDPKGDLGPVLAREAHDRLHTIVPSETGLDLMAGPDWRLDDDLAAGRYVSAAMRIVLRVLGFEPALPTRVLAEPEVPDGSSNAAYFDRDGSALLLTTLAFILMVMRPGAPPPEQWCAEPARGWVRGLLDRAHGRAGARGQNALAVTAFALDTGFPLGSDSTFIIGGDDDPPWLFGVAATGAASVWGVEPGEARDLLERVKGYWRPMADEAPRQFAGVLSSARVACSAVAEPELANVIYFGCEPGAAGTADLARELERAVSRDAPGRVFLYQPSRSGLDALVGKVLKALWFEAVLNDPDRVRGGLDLPLVGYVADEAHRFITSDPVHGEQSFLDTCRSFGVACVLACQSAASIEHALAQRGGGGVQDRAALGIIWNNTGTKLYFRSTDPHTAERVDDACPIHPGLARVTRVRPLSSLAPGECYAVLADGRFERRQLAPVLPARDCGEERSRSRVLAPRARPAPGVARGSES
ncbi:MAG: type IV secretory system conjugative DNA transfer family protein, partial [Gammaproteobacteria bacterium]|nr:type IV secretory system conjugative DNA transfer family protein [Gammaproteobacteria bacterium]